MSSARLNLQTASREELVDLIRRQNTSLKEQKAHLASAESKIKQQQQELQAAATSKPAAPVAATTSHTNGGGAGADADVVDEYEMRLASLAEQSKLVKEELAAAKRAKRDESEAMQQQIQLLSEKVANDEETMASLRERLAEGGAGGGNAAGLGNAAAAAAVSDQEALVAQLEKKIAELEETNQFYAAVVQRNDEEERAEERRKEEESHTAASQEAPTAGGSAAQATPSQRSSQQPVARRAPSVGRSSASGTRGPRSERSGVIAATQPSQNASDVVAQLSRDLELKTNEVTDLRERVNELESEIGQVRGRYGTERRKQLEVSEALQAAEEQLAQMMQREAALTRAWQATQQKTPGSSQAAAATNVVGSSTPTQARQEAQILNLSPRPDPAVSRHPESSSTAATPTQLSADASEITSTIRLLLSLDPIAVRTNTASAKEKDLHQRLQLYDSHLRQLLDFEAARKRSVDEAERNRADMFAAMNTQLERHKREVTELRGRLRNANAGRVTGMTPSPSASRLGASASFGDLQGMSPSGVDNGSLHSMPQGVAPGGLGPDEAEALQLRVAELESLLEDMRRNASQAAPPVQQQEVVDTVRQEDQSGTINELRGTVESLQVSLAENESRSEAATSQLKVALQQASDAGEAFRLQAQDAEQLLQDARQREATLVAELETVKETMTAAPAIPVAAPVGPQSATTNEGQQQLPSEADLAAQQAATEALVAKTATVTDEYAALCTALLESVHTIIGPNAQQQHQQQQNSAAIDEELRVDLAKLDEVFAAQREALELERSLRISLEVAQAESSAATAAATVEESAAAPPALSTQSEDLRVDEAAPSEVEPSQDAAIAAPESTVNNVQEPSEPSTEGPACQSSQPIPETTGLNSDATVYDAPELTQQEATEDVNVPREEEREPEPPLLQEAQTGQESSPTEAEPNGLDLPPPGDEQPPSYVDSNGFDATEREPEPSSMDAHVAVEEAPSNGDTEAHPQSSQEVQPAPEREEPPLAISANGRSATEDDIAFSPLDVDEERVATTAPVAPPIPAEAQFVEAPKAVVPPFSAPPPTAFDPFGFPVAEQAVQSVQPTPEYVQHPPPHQPPPAVPSLGDTSWFSSPPPAPPPTSGDQHQTPPMSIPGFGDFSSPPPQQQQQPATASDMPSRGSVSMGSSSAGMLSPRNVANNIALDPFGELQEASPPPGATPVVNEVQPQQQQQQQQPPVPFDPFA